jgi:hypothetical protein
VIIIFRSDHSKKFIPQTIQNVISWVFPVIFTIIPLSLKLFGRNVNRSFFCWITENNFPFEIVFLYVPFTLVLLISIFFWIVIIGKLIQMLCNYKNMVNHSNSTYIENIIRHLMFIFMICFSMLLLASEGIYVSIMKKENFIFSLLDAIPVCSHGIMILFVFGFTKNNLKNWFQFFKYKVFGCVKDLEENTEYVDDDQLDINVDIDEDDEGDKSLIEH